MQKPAHSVPGTVLAGADGTCVYTVVTVKTEHGELTATVCTPRALLSSAVANDLSDGEMALLVVLNAGVPGHLRGGLSQGFQVRGLVGIRSERAAAVHLRSQSPHCRVEQETLRKRFDELSRHNASCHYDERGRVISGSLHLVLSHELARAAAERVEQERQAELAQTGNMLNLQIQGSAVERAAEALGSDPPDDRVLDLPHVPIARSVVSARCYLAHGPSPSNSTTERSLQASSKAVVTRLAHCFSASHSHIRAETRCSRERLPAHAAKSHSGA